MEHRNRGLRNFALSLLFNVYPSFILFKEKQNRVKTKIANRCLLKKGVMTSLLDKRHLLHCLSANGL